MPVPDVIQKRVSCRNYSDIPLEPDLHQRVLAILKAPHQGPFGGWVRFELLDFSAGVDQGPRRLGTYGFIRNATLYVVGAVRQARWARADFGYCMERVILELTGLGLGTCWLALFDRTAVGSEFKPSLDEIIPAVTPVGYPAGKRTLADILVRLVARSNSRKPWSDLFFHADSGKPLSHTISGDYARCLESVRLAPSHSNKQPWRVFLDTNRGTAGFHALGNSHLDLGIAMYHFEMTARRNGLRGNWTRFEPDREIPGLTYIATWVSEK